MAQSNTLCDAWKHPKRGGPPRPPPPATEQWGGPWRHTRWWWGRGGCSHRGRQSKEGQQQRCDRPVASGRLGPVPADDAPHGSAVNEQLSRAPSKKKMKMKCVITDRHTGTGYTRFGNEKQKLRNFLPSLTGTGERKRHQPGWLPPPVGDPQKVGRHSGRGFGGRNTRPSKMHRGRDAAQIPWLPPPPILHPAWHSLAPPLPPGLS